MPDIPAHTPVGESAILRSRFILYLKIGKWIPYY
jgi:hypothetical protein